MTGTLLLDISVRPFVFGTEPVVRPAEYPTCTVSTLMLETVTRQTDKCTTLEFVFSRPLGLS